MEYVHETAREVKTTEDFDFAEYYEENEVQKSRFEQRS